jgi:hypothetical protein
MSEGRPDDPRGDEPAADGLPSARLYTTTALPSTTARLLAFVAILLGGLCGGLIGWSVTDLQCGGGATSGGGARTEVATPADDGCTAWSAGGALIGSVAGAGGVGVVSVLVLRAMAEWRRTLEVEELPRGSTPPPRP